MPGYGTSASGTATQHPGRSAPVRGVTSQQSVNDSTDINTTTAASASSSMSSPRQQHGQQYTHQPHTTQSHPLGWDRPFSSGVPAPAVAVPIFRAAHAVDLSSGRNTTAHLPDSPPDTPPHSPGLHPVRLPSFVEPRQISPPRLSALNNERNAGSWAPSTRNQEVAEDQLYTGQTPCDSELESNADTDFSDDGSDATLDQLTQAAQTLLLHHQHKSQRHSPDSSMVSTHRELMPATPEISPDNDVRHHAQKSAHAFLHRIFDDVPSDLAVEDAGIELISPGWSGAVIKSGPASVCHAPSSLSSNYSSDSSVESQRTLYVTMPALVDATLLREQVLAVLDAASEKLGCESVMVCLERAMLDFASVLHGLCYVGGAMVAAAHSKEQQDFGIGHNQLPDADPVSGLQMRDGLVLVAIEL